MSISGFNGDLSTAASPNLRSSVPVRSIDHGQRSLQSSTTGGAGNFSRNDFSPPDTPDGKFSARHSKTGSTNASPSHHGGHSENPSVSAGGGGTGGNGEGKTKKGRRANRGAANSVVSWFDGEASPRPADTELNKDVASVVDGVADQEQAKSEQAARAQRQREHLAQHIADPPTGYQATLPRLNELDVSSSWDRLLRMLRNEYDMSCLTSCLAGELDEDVAWNPEMLLVQLTSDLLDAAELQKENELYVPVDASVIGQMTGGEVTRQRTEKSTPVPASVAAAAAAAAASKSGDAPGRKGVSAVSGPGASPTAPSTAAAEPTPVATASIASPPKRSVSKNKFFSGGSPSKKESSAQGGKKASIKKESKARE